MKLSFKFKIAIISFAVSGTLLTTFGIVFFAFIYQAGLDRIDRELRTLADSSLHGNRPRGHWKTFDQSLQFIYGSNSTSRTALLVREDQDRIVFKSANAPAELSKLSPSSRPAPPDNDPADSNALFFKLDTNRDNQLDPLEFDGPIHIFQQADLDGDGILTADEAEILTGPPHMGPGSERPGPEGRGARGQVLTVLENYQTLKTSSGNWRAGVFSDPRLTFIVAMDMDAFYFDINRFRTTFLIAVPLGLFILGITGWFLAGRAMKPVALIADTAEGITAKGLDKRIPQVGNDIELDRLVHVTNNMLDRLEKSYHQAVRFSADAAHELQTPLTILQGELDNAIQSSEDGSSEQQCYSMLLEELRNLKAVVQKLLILAHADEGRLKLNTQSIDLSELIRDAAEDIEIMAPELKIETNITSNISVSADPALLNQTIRNMISNAAKYANKNGLVVFSLKKDKSAIHFTLANTASPIPEEDKLLIFDRFHRVEKSRTTAGSGLGLSLAREIARAHHGDLALDPYVDGMVSFTLTFELA